MAKAKKSPAKKPAAVPAGDAAQPVANSPVETEAEASERVYRAVRALAPDLVDRIEKIEKRLGAVENSVNIAPPARQGTAEDRGFKKGPKAK